MDDVDMGRGVGPAGFLQSDITDEARHAMGVDAPEVGAEQCCGGGMSVLFGAADAAKDIDGEGEQALIGKNH